MFSVTATFSILAYIWMLIVLMVITPNVVDIVEGSPTSSHTLFSLGVNPQPTKEGSGAGLDVLGKSVADARPGAYGLRGGQASELFTFVFCPRLPRGAMDLFTVKEPLCRCALRVSHLKG